MEERNEICGICGERFTDEEWESRHWLEDVPDAEVHERCCPVCKED